MKTQRKGFQGLNLATVAVNDITVTLNTTAISKEKRTVHHGDFKGEKVNSPETCKFGESVIIWAESGKSDAIAMPKAAMGLMCKQYLESEGCTVTVPAAS